MYNSTIFSFEKMIKRKLISLEKVYYVLYN